jgi:hypothetical protein
LVVFAEDFKSIFKFFLSLLGFAVLGDEFEIFAEVLVILSRNIGIVIIMHK